MRVPVLLAALTLSLSTSASAQDWTEYISREDGFRVDFPGQPTITQRTYTSEYGLNLPARVYTVNRGVDRYSITVVDYRNIQTLADERAKATCPTGFADERACGLVNAGRGYWKEELGGALLHATYDFIRRDAKVTHLAWAWQDLVEGHEIQLTNNADQSRTFGFVTMHGNRLYILEGTVPGNYPPPGLFQQSMGFVDEAGRGVRYQSIYSNLYAEWPKDFPEPPLRTGQGGRGAGPAPAPQQPQGR
ncbi:MAG: hypothetical protein HY824_14730 [Acidobacteria bacterium]|nr:hypothetical protein [Acidobacteriota bacterium]